MVMRHVPGLAAVPVSVLSPRCRDGEPQASHTNLRRPCSGMTRRNRVVGEAVGDWRRNSLQGMMKAIAQESHPRESAPSDAPVVGRHERARDRHRQAAEIHKRAADYHEEHAAAEHELGNEATAAGMERRADDARERAQREAERADEEQARLDRERESRDPNSREE